MAAALLRVREAAGFAVEAVAVEALAVEALAIEALADGAAAGGEAAADRRESTAVPPVDLPPLAFPEPARAGLDLDAEDFETVAVAEDWFSRTVLDIRSAP